MSARLLNVVHAPLTLLTNVIDVLDCLRGEFALLGFLHHTLLLNAKLLEFELRTAESFLHLLEHLRTQFFRQLRLNGNGYLD